MFDDPKLRLYELDEALKAAEYDEEMEDTEPDWLQEAKDLLNESATEVLPIRNKANNYGREPEPQAPPRGRKMPDLVYADEDLPEPDALFVEKPPRKGAGGLVFLALLELIGIALVILWWMRWTL